MYVLIIGGGRTGSHLASLLSSQGHEVRIIEDRPTALVNLHRELPTEFIFEGDGTDPQVLEAVDIRRAQVLVAVGGEDADNLVAASLAREHYGVKRVIGRVNNPRNSWLFDQNFCVDVSLNQAEILAHLIEEEMSMGDMMTLLKLRRGNYSLVEEKIPPGASAVGISIKDLGLPDQCVIAAIIRKGEVMIPRGLTEFQEGDEVLAVTDEDGARQLARLLAPPRRPEIEKNHNHSRNGFDH